VSESLNFKSFKVLRKNKTMKEHTLLWSAIHELKIDVPVMRYEIKGDKVTLHLYGGQVVTWLAPSVEGSPKAEQPAPKHEGPAAPSKPAKSGDTISSKPAPKPKSSKPKA
jgi:hypothetical protein